MNRKRAIRATVAFFTGMLLLTFCSRTIYRSTLETVEAQKPIGGVLTYYYTVREFSLEGDGEQGEYLPAPLSRPLTVERVYATPGEYVEAGESIASFSKPEGEYILSQARAGLRDATAEYETWKLQWTAQKAALEEEMGKAETPREAERLQEEMRVLLSGVLNGQSEETLLQKRAEAQSALSALEALKKADWTHRASASGTVCSVAVKKGDGYSGLSPIARIADGGITLKAELTGAPDTREQGWKQQASVQTNADIYAANVRDIRDGFAEIRLPEGVRASDVLEIRVRLDSPYRAALVPNEALRADEAFLLEASVGDWGQTVYTVRRVAVTAGGSDGQYTEITEGLRSSDRVVVRSTAELSDGQTVSIEGYK